MNIDDARAEYAGVENWLNQFAQLQAQQPQFVARFQFLAGYISAHEAPEDEAKPVEEPKPKPTPNRAARRAAPKKKTD